MGRSVKPFAKGVRWKNGQWRYRVPRWVDDATCCRLFDCKREITLGVTVGDASAKYADLMKALHFTSHARTMGELMDRYVAEVVPTKKPTTQRSNVASVSRLRAVFGSILIPDFESPWAFQYRDKNKHRQTTANRDLEVLSHLFSMAIQWGYLKNEQHPMRGLRVKAHRPARSRSPSLQEVGKFLAHANPILRAYVVLKLATGPRKADMLRLRLTDAKPDGIHVTHGKTGKPTVYVWNDERRAAWEACKAARPKRIASLTHLFCTRQGKPYVDDAGDCSGFDSIWQRAMVKAVADGLERFTEHDLRRTVADKAMTMDEARRLLGHSTESMTRKVYRTRPEEA